MDQKADIASFLTGCLLLFSIDIIHPAEPSLQKEEFVAPAKQEEATGIRNTVYYHKGTKPRRLEEKTLWVIFRIL